MSCPSCVMNERDKLPPGPSARVRASEKRRERARTHPFHEAKQLDENDEINSRCRTWRREKKKHTDLPNYLSLERWLARSNGRRFPSLVSSQQKSDHQKSVQVEESAAITVCRSEGTH